MLGAPTLAPLQADGSRKQRLSGGLMTSIHLGLAATSALLLATSIVLAASETEMSQQYSSCIDKAN
jgi:hypothetical protein